MNIADQPHVLVFLGYGAGGTRPLYPCRAGRGIPSIDVHYAIFPDRAAADACRHLWGSDSGSPHYFAVPAAVLFDVVTVVPPPTQTFTLKPGF